MGKGEGGGEQSSPLQLILDTLMRLQFCAKSPMVGAPMCPSCKRLKPEGHTDECELVKGMGTLKEMICDG